MSPMEAAKKVKKAIEKVIPDAEIFLHDKDAGWGAPTLSWGGILDWTAALTGGSPINAGMTGKWSKEQEPELVAVMEELWDDGILAEPHNGSDLCFYQNESR